ncbi:MAG: DUF1704 domain-containing protein, partial [Parcubacteria group bacterium]|nr:DUF1704 domain-containing protein [Parcubacteria group bacterium]
SPLQDAAAIQQAFKQALAAHKISGWKIRLDEQNLNAFVHINQEKKELVLPTRRTLTQRHLEALVRHEVGVHIRRSVNAQKTKLQLLTIGLDHYLRGEEGLAKYEEMRTLPSSFEIYLGTGLIKGVDGRKRDFRETYEFFKQYYLASQFHHDEVSAQQAADESWTRTEKFFRGTTGQSAGICFTKDLMYLEGYLSIVQTIKDHPEEEKRFFAGKYDPSNAFHRQVLDEIGVV